MYAPQVVYVCQAQKAGQIASQCGSIDTSHDTRAKPISSRLERNYLPSNRQSHWLP